MPPTVVDAKKRFWLVFSGVAGAFVSILMLCALGLGFWSFRWASDVPPSPSLLWSLIGLLGLIPSMLIDSLGAVPGAIALIAAGACIGVLIYKLFHRS